MKDKVCRMNPHTEEKLKENTQREIFGTSSGRTPSGE
jgi:hypothetical protein